MFNVVFNEKKGKAEYPVVYEHVTRFVVTDDSFLLYIEGGEEIKLSRDKYRCFWSDDDDKNYWWEENSDWRGYGEEPEDIPEED